MSREHKQVGRMPSKYQTELQIGLDAVRAAARVCTSVQSKITPDVLEKHDRSPVTVADFASQAAICRQIGDAFPKDPIIGEEDSASLHRAENAAFLEQVLDELRQIEIDASAQQACAWIDRGAEKQFRPRFWTLDPIDGTKGFLRKEQYAIALALLIEGRIEVAILGCPNLGGLNKNGVGTIFYALRGEGSWAIPIEGAVTPERVQTSHVADPTTARFCESIEASHTAQGLSQKVAESLGMSREPLRMDSQAKYAVVARGEAEIYLRLPAKFGYKEKIWDHAAGVLVIEESGGRVSDVMGMPLEFSHGYELLANRGIVAANRELHSRVIAALHEIYAKYPPPTGSTVPTFN